MSGSSPIAGRVKNLRRTATRMTVPIGVAALMMATVVPVASASPSDVPSPDKTALVVGGTTIPTPDQAYLDAVRDNFVAPTQSGDIKYVAVTTPEEGWPLTGILRVAIAVFGPADLRFSSSLWPDEPLWKLSGLFDRTFDQSVQQGVTDLDTAIADNGGNHLVIFGFSQGAIVANIEKQKLADQYPAGTQAPDISFVLIGDPNAPNGGLFARFPGLHIPILDWTLNGPAPTDTQFHTVDVIQQYDGFADFPLYPVNVLADVNAVFGILYTHTRDLEPSLADPSATVIHTTTGDTDYSFFPTDNLPLFGPLRTIGVPEPVIDVVEPATKVIVETGYDRTIPPGEPTPARLIPQVNPVKVTHDLIDAVHEGADNAIALPTKLTPAKPTSTSLTGGLKFTPAKPTSSTGDNQIGGPAAKFGANVGDTLRQAADNVKKTVRHATDSVTRGLSGLNGHNVDSNS
jgi:PE-PPE domain